MDLLIVFKFSPFTGWIVGGEEDDEVVEGELGGMGESISFSMSLPSSVSTACSWSSLSRSTSSSPSLSQHSTKVSTSGEGEVALTDESTGDSLSCDLADEVVTVEALDGLLLVVVDAVIVATAVDVDVDFDAVAVVVVVVVVDSLIVVANDGGGDGVKGDIVRSLGAGDVVISGQHFFLTDKSRTSIAEESVIRRSTPMDVRCRMLDVGC